MLTDEEIMAVIIRAAEIYGAGHQHQRYGQALFNALHELHPDLANEARGSADDPFYNEGAVNRFILRFIDAERAEATRG